MRSIFYQLVLNAKWFCSSNGRCLGIALLITIPYEVPSVYTIVNGAGWNFFPAYLLPYFVGFTLLVAFLFRILGVSLKNFHPPLSWKKSTKKAPRVLLNLLLVLPFFGLIETLIFNDFIDIDVILWIEISILPLLILFLINRKTSNEDEKLANSQAPSVSAENITPKRLRIMRIGSIIQALIAAVFLVLYIRTNTKLDSAQHELIIQQYRSTDVQEQLQLQIDSLRSELNLLKQKKPK